MPVPFTQFLMPNGRRQEVTIDQPPEIEALAKRIIAAGHRFEIEMLRTGEISMEIVRDVPDADIDDSIAGEICPNGPPVHLAVEKMIRDAANILQLLPEPKTP